MNDFEMTNDSNHLRLRGFKSSLVISDGFCIDLPHKKPNAWVRFWQRFLLGWRWEDV